MHSPSPLAALGSAFLVSGVAAALATALPGCGGTPPTMQGRSGLLSQTAVAQKCEEAARGHDRPFVVEWDATDLASFETKAARDTVVVKYQGCTLDVLYGCSDAIAGHFGTYGTPHSTSGTVQGFDIANDGDLYAKLPLGAATLSGRVEAGERLHLKYFVSGVATSTRDALFQDEIGKIPACAGATHFVWAYNLGAFELGTKESNSESGKAGIGNIGGGADRSHSAESVAQGGSIDTCSTNDQRACRVPIRLALRPISAGANPLGPQGGDAAPTSAANGGAPTDAMTAYSGSAAAQAAHAFNDAVAKLNAGDGAACLALLDRAANLDARELEMTSFQSYHSRCRMASGDCDGGMRDERARIANADINHVKSDDQLDAETRDLANQTCASSTAKPGHDNDFVARALPEIAAARKAKDSDACARLFDAVASHLPAAEQEDRKALGDRVPGDHTSFLKANQALESAAFCVAESKGCDAGLPYHKRAHRIALHSTTVKDSVSDKAATDSWATLQKLGQLKCQ